MGVHHVDVSDEEPHTRPRRGVLVFALLAVFSVTGLSYAISNLGDVAPYGDTRINLWLARTERVDPFRGVLYPHWLAAADELHGGDSFLPAFGEWKEPETAEHLRGLWVLQVFQIGVAVAGLAYFLWVAGRLGLRPSGKRAAFLLGALLLLDPMLLHYTLTIMVDGPALSASLVFLAAFAGLVTRATPALPTWGMLVLAQGLLIALRVEKNWVVLGTAVGSVLVWMLVRRSEVPLRRFATVTAVCAVGFAALVAYASSQEYSKRRWPLKTQLLHQRVVYRNVERTYDTLPQDLRSRMTREQAVAHDREIFEARRMLRWVTGNDDEQVVELVDGLAAHALRERWFWIAADIVRDTAENLLATISFYAHLPGAVLIEPQTENWLHDWRTDNTAKIYRRYAFHHPVLARVHLIVGGLVTLAALVVALVSRRGSRWRVEQWAAVTPAALFCLLNAGVFAATQDLTQIRYTLVAHALFLFAVYSAAIRALGPPRPQ